MIIDAHTHIHLDPGAPSQTVTDLLTAMDAAGIGKAAVFGAPINNLTTERVIEETAPHADRLFVVGSVSPFMEGFIRPPEAVDGWLASGRVRALKFYTGYEHFYPADERLRPYLELLVKHDRPVIFHSGDLYDKIPGAKLKYSHPLAVDELAAEMPDLKIIIAHLGSPWALDAAQVCYKNRNVHADCSGFTYGPFDERNRARFLRMWETFDEVNEGEAADKILFGTDWPISAMDSYIETVRACVKAPEGLEKVLSGNAVRLFGP